MLCHILRSNCVDENKVVGRSYEFSSYQLIVMDCLFKRLSSYSDYGGVICLRDKSNLTLSDSSFYNCRSSNHGGAVYFYAMNALVERCCGNNCRGNDGHFIYLYSIANAHLLKMVHVSVLKSNNETTGQSALYFLQGNQRCYGSNSSKNLANVASGIIFFSPYSLDCSYCTFSDNNAKAYMTLYVYGNSMNNLSYCCFTNNSTPSLGIVYINYAYLVIKDSVFINNIGVLFHVAAHSITLSNVYYGHQGTLSSGTVVSGSICEPFTLALEHYATFYCDASLKLFVKEKFTTNPPIGQISTFSFIFVVFL